MRDRSVSSLHSKVVVSGLVAASSFPADDLAVALLCFLQARCVSPPKDASPTIGRFEAVLFALLLILT